MGCDPYPKFVVGWKIADHIEKLELHRNFRVVLKHRKKANGDLVGKPFRVMEINLDALGEEALLEPLVGDRTYLFLGTELRVEPKEEGWNWHDFLEADPFDLASLFETGFQEVAGQLREEFKKVFNFDPGMPKLYYGIEWS